MPKVVGYHRPTSVEEAVGLLGQPGAAVLAGGTRLNASREGASFTAVDVQALRLSGVESLADGRIRIGAATTLQQLLDNALVPDGVRGEARREAPSTMRTLATVGGTVAVGTPSSALLAALLVHDAVVTVAASGGADERALADVLADPTCLDGALITHVTIATDGRFAAARTGRTPADEPIVAAAARRGADGVTRLALAGVARTPMLVDDPASLDPPGDFRGSTEYRRHVAHVLAARVVTEVSA